MLRVFIGYDPRETIAWHVAAHSIMARASQPVSITALRLDQLPLTRPREGSTEFAFSRFLVPWLCDYDGAALFIDCDVLCRADIAELFSHEPFGAVSVVKHRYTPIPGRKFLGNAQRPYARKNWSSVMLFNCAQCKALSVDYVNSAPGLKLHQFAWIRNDDRIEELPREWNHLVGEYLPNPVARIAHFTRGGPWFPEYADCEFADEWRAERDAMLRAG